MLLVGRARRRDAAALNAAGEKPTLLPNTRREETPSMRTFRTLYPQVWSFENLLLAWRRAARGKRSRP